MRTVLEVLLAAFVAFAPLRAAAAETRISCQVNALSKAEWAHLEALVPRLRAAVSGESELSNGYEFRFAAAALPLVGEWTWYVARCCPAVDYRIEIGPSTGGALWLQLTGGEGVKEFVSIEFEKLLQAAEAKAGAR